MRIMVPPTLQTGIIMRSTLVAAALVLASMVPAVADDASDLAAAKDAIAAAKLSPASELNMWCGAAFTLYSQAMKQGGDADKAKAADANATALFGKAAPLLTADGVASGDMGAMSTNYMTVAAAQLINSTEPPAHTQEECQAAVDAQ
ncbi:MAG: hypothetical protein P4M09_30915 [Devosia sp.]|nr:hypothetical protein [Devosia sp.]